MIGGDQRIMSAVDGKNIEKQFGIWFSICPFPLPEDYETFVQEFQ